MDAIPLCDITKVYTDIYVNTKQYLIKKFIPGYANIKLPNTSPAARITQKKVHIMRIQDEIRLLYKLLCIDVNICICVYPTYCFQLH